MKILVRIAMSVVCSLSMAALVSAQHGGGGGGHAAAGSSSGHVGTGHPSGNRFNRFTNHAAGSPGGFRREQTGGGTKTTSPTRTITRHASFSGRHYENWGSDIYATISPQFGINFNFGINFGLMNRNFEFYLGRFGRPDVRCFSGSGGGEWGDHFRVGYFGWPGWKDSNFYFESWLFNPFGIPCVVSPFYGYPWMPPFIRFASVLVDSGARCDWNSGIAYSFRLGEDNWAYGNHALNSAVGQLGAIFTQESNDAIDFVVSPSQRVAIYNDGNYMYSVSGNDFRSMLVDDMRSTHTDSFSVLAVRTDGNDAIVQCKHTFDNPLDAKSSIYQMYRLSEVSGQYVVTGFQSSLGPVQA